jgi:hypothetical protein
MFLLAVTAPVHPDNGSPASFAASRLDARMRTNDGESGWPTGREAIEASNDRRAVIPAAESEATQGASSSPALLASRSAARLSANTFVARSTVCRRKFQVNIASLPQALVVSGSEAGA